MNTYFLKNFGTFLFLLSATAYCRFDVNVIGLLGVETTAPLIGTTIIDVLRDKVSVNLIPSRYYKNGVVQTQFVADLPFSPDEITIDSPHLAPVSLLTDVLGYKDQPNYVNVPETKIKLAYSMFESDRLCADWVDILNQTFDAVIVPDECLVDIYHKSGVKIPVFVIPLPIYIDDMLELPLKKQQDGLFVFGVSAGFDVRKNHNLLIAAFAREFGNNKNVKLKIHGSWGNAKPILNKIESLNLKNVELVNKKLTRQEYIDFMASLDAYVFLSMGEGYSITPRDALALGLPCILLDHTVHKTMCTLPSVLGIEPYYEEKAYFRQMKTYCGNWQQANIDSVRYALRTMYNRYQYFLSRAYEGKEWVRQFTRDRLASYFVTAIKPQKVVLGTVNTISQDTLTTTSERLYKKYRNIMNDQGSSERSHE
jgi:glycosyltransferase involved in cell wall biosynthesis